MQGSICTARVGEGDGILIDQVRGIDRPGPRLGCQFDRVAGREERELENLAAPVPISVIRTDDSKGSAVS